LEVLQKCKTQGVVSLADSKHNQQHRYLARNLLINQALEAASLEALAPYSNNRLQLLEYRVLEVFLDNQRLSVPLNQALAGCLVKAQIKLKLNKVSSNLWNLIYVI